MLDADAVRAAGGQGGTMTNERIAEIRARLAKLPKEPWSRETHDVVRGDNRYGSDPYNVLVDDDGKAIADSMNSDLRCIEGNCDDGFLDSGTLNAFELFVHAPQDIRDLLEALTSQPAPSADSVKAFRVLIAEKAALGVVNNLKALYPNVPPNLCFPHIYLALLDANVQPPCEPAPSGWQQRIAAMFPYPTTQAADQCKFCGEEHGHKPDCLWQNAVDALPPANASSWQSASSAPEDGLPFLAFGPELADEDFTPDGIVEACYAGDGFIGAIWNNCSDEWMTQPIKFTHWTRVQPPGCPARPPAPEVKDASRHMPERCIECGADVCICDPIVSAVRAELQPLEDALIDAGHKLAKDGER
jgi:hypothetical protein